MICSICVPSRARFNRLKKLIESIAETACVDNVECLIRLDSDDEESVDRMHELEMFPNVGITVGPRLRGFGSVPIFWNELYEKSNGTWSWLLSDDMSIDGKGWDEQLKSIPTWGVVVNPQFHKLGGSTYERELGGPFQLFPRGALAKLGCNHIPDPPDVGIDTIFRLNNRWEVRWLDGISVWHQRDDDNALSEHRKI